ncbi:MAG: acetyltransferase [Phycisphaerales bacterium]|nr:acetyltransferase [Phycisphaerales bacterium]
MTAAGSEKLALIGGGGHALVVAEAATASGWTISGYLDDAVAPALARLRHVGVRLGDLGAALPREGSAILALGDLASRRIGIDARVDTTWAIVVHPSAIVLPSATIRPGVFVSAGAVVQTLVHLDVHCILNTGCIVEHECSLGENVHVGPRAVLCGRVEVGMDTLIGAGAVVLPNVKVGTRCVIGAGAVVREDVPDGATVVGVPGRANNPVACARG